MALARANSAVELFDDHGNLLEVISRHATFDDARAAYAATLTKPRRADRIVMLCLKAQIL